jgi:hypothetical protein
MKLIRLPSGTLACVYPVEVQTQRGSQRGKLSGVYRAFSGSIEADGPSEDQAIEALDAEVRRLSAPPPPELEEFALARVAANADTTGRYRRYSDPPTIPAPASSSRG